MDLRVQRLNSFVLEAKLFIELGDIEDNEFKLLIYKSRNAPTYIGGLLIRIGFDKDGTKFNLIKKFCTRGDKLDKIKDIELEVEFQDNGLDKVGENPDEVYVR